jgi:hypothetical protein
MTPLFKKLNYKNQTSIVSINSPSSFKVELFAMEKFTTITTSLKDVKEIEFAICFASTQKEIDQFVKSALKKLKGDALLWMCYPKMKSKNYTCDFNRDTGWYSFGEYNLEPVRQVSIDEDWSGLRFRNVDYIKTITRKESYALTAEAKKRTTKKGE